MKGQEINMKKLFVVLISAVLFAGCASGEDSRPVDETEATNPPVTEAATEAVTQGTSAAATTAAAEPEAPAPEFTSDEAEKYYNIIMNDTGWRRKPHSIGATLLDLYGDGAPEFLVADDEWKADCYSVKDGKLIFNCTFEIDSYYMTKYQDDDGIKWWGRITSEDGIENYGLLTITESGAELTEKLFGLYEKHDVENDTYLIETYINGELFGRDFTENYSEIGGPPDMIHYSEWFRKKYDWEEENLSDAISFDICPNERWKPDADISEDIHKLVNAYFDNDYEYLTSKLDFGGGAMKPVIYLYPEAETDVSVKLMLNGRFTCTYPDYGDGWNVRAMPDGTVYDNKDGREYSYLYWEGALNTGWDMSRGFVVKGEDTAEFLREKLSYMGLTPREYNEFIVYWLPQMQGNKYNLITFQTKSYTDAAGLFVNPAPDSMLRIFMAYKPLDEEIDIPEQELSAWTRKGFAVVEWGGTKAE